MQSFSPDCCQKKVVLGSLYGLNEKAWLLATLSQSPGRVSSIQDGGCKWTKPEQHALLLFCGFLYALNLLASAYIIWLFLQDGLIVRERANLLQVLKITRKHSSNHRIVYVCTVTIKFLLKSNAGLIKC